MNYYLQIQFMESRQNFACDILFIHLSHKKINLRKDECLHFLSKIGNNCFVSSCLRLNFPCLKVPFLFPGKAFLFIQMLSIFMPWAQKNVAIVPVEMQFLYITVVLAMTDKFVPCILLNSVLSPLKMRSYMFVKRC